MDRFEGLRRSGDISVGLVDSVHGKGESCQFDETTGWPQYGVNQGTPDTPGAVCQILKTELRGISPRQLLALYEHVKRCCVTEGWKRRDGTALTPETVTLYDLNTYVILPSTEARRHECQFDENGAQRRERMSRSEVPEGKEITCTQCAVKLKKTSDRAVAYWQCHQRCGGKHTWCGACACCSFVELVSGVGTQSVRRCADGQCGHVPMARSKVYPDKFGDAEEIACTQCAAKLELHAPYWLCHRCGGKHRLCSECAPKPAPVPCRELQRPLWFVSHWWGEPLFQFISCLLQHARDRYYLTADDDSWLDIPYWVCAYANNQHALGEDVTTDPACSAFARAMAESIGTLSVLDTNGVVFTRIWCCYEVSKSVEKAKVDRTKLYDMGTANTAAMAPPRLLRGREPVPTSAVVLCDGDAPVPADMFQHPLDPDRVLPEASVALHKATRVARFPVELLLSKAFLVKIEAGEATESSDKLHILNALVGSRVLDGPAPAEHAEYDRINRLLRAHYALGGLPRCTAKGGEALLLCLAALKEAPPTDRFCCKLAFDTETVHRLLGLLPPTLQHLLLLKACMTSVPESVGKFDALVSLDLGDCDKLTALPDSVGKLTALCTLNLAGCSGLASLPSSVNNLTALQTLILNGCSGLRALPELLGELAGLITLDLNRCENLAALPESVGSLVALRTLDLCNCATLEALPQSVGNLTSLRTLNLDGCMRLRALPASIGDLAELHVLSLFNCSSLAVLPETVGRLAQLDGPSRQQVEAGRGAPP